MTLAVVALRDRTVVNPSDRDFVIAAEGGALVWAAAAQAKKSEEAAAESELEAETSAAAAEVAAASVGVFPSVAEGIDATTDGQTFYVAEGGTVKLYRNDSGIAAEEAEVFTMGLASSPEGASSIGFGPNLTVERKLKQRVCILDYCSEAEQDDVLSNTGAMDVSGAWQAAFDDLSPNGTLYTGGGTHRLSAPVSMSSKARIRIEGEGARILETSPANVALLSFTSCDYLSVLDLHFVGVEDQAYWAANSPTQRRTFILATTSSNVRIKDVTGEGKRGLIRLDNCTRSIVDSIDFEGFFPADATNITNSNFTTAVNISGGRHNKLANSHAEKIGSICTWGIDGVGHTVSGCTGRYLHDNGIYGSSGSRCRAFGNDFSDVYGSAVKLRGSLNMAFGNSGENVGTLIALSGNGATPDAFGANGFGNIAALNSGATARNNGVSLDDQDGYSARDTVVAFNAIIGAPGTLGNGGITGAVKRGLVVAGNVLSEVSGNYGILAAGTASLQIQSSCFMGNVITSFTGGQQPIRANYMKDAAFIGNVTGDSAALIQTRQSADVSFVGNVNAGGIAVSATSANVNTGVVATGQRGSANIPNSGSVSGANSPNATLPGVSSAPAAIGLIAVASGNVYVSIGTSSSSDWKLVS